MSSLNELKNLDSSKPFFNHKNAVLSAPIRHLFMIGTLEYLSLNKSLKEPNILEIGSWFGASTLSWAQGIKEYYKSKGSISCVDAWISFFDMDLHKENEYAKEMESLLQSDFAYKAFLHNIGTIDRSIVSQHYRGQSDNILPQLKDAIYDIVFIDADHTYKPVLKDIKNSMRLVKEGGVICGDDLNMQMNEIDKTHMSENKEKDFINDPLTKKNYHPGVTLAVHEIFGEVSSWGGFWAMQKKNETWHKFSLKNMQVIYPNDHIEKAKSHYNDIKSNIL